MKNLFIVFLCGLLVIFCAGVYFREESKSLCNETLCSDLNLQKMNPNVPASIFFKKDNFDYSSIEFHINFVNIPSIKQYIHSPYLLSVNYIGVDKPFEKTLFGNLNTHSKSIKGLDVSVSYVYMYRFLLNNDAYNFFKECPTNVNVFLESNYPKLDKEFKMVMVCNDLNFVYQIFLDDKESFMLNYFFLQTHTQLENQSETILRVNG